MATLIKPMLAKVYAPHLYQRGMLVQPKLNGIRMLAQGRNLVSRDGELWSDQCLQHIREELRAFPEHMIFDGELYNHRLSLQEINSRVAVKRVSPHKDEAVVVYCIFDYVSREPMLDRAGNLSRLFKNLMVQPVSIRHVPTYLTTSSKDADRHYAAFKSDKYEGMMYREPSMPYAIQGDKCVTRKDNRVDWLLKRKDWLDVNATIIRVNEGEGRHQGTMGSFTLCLANGTLFNAGSGPTDLERSDYWRLGPRLTGCLCKIQYETLSDQGVPLKPVIIQVDLPI